MGGTGGVNAHLGGIGAMLEAADICPKCGEVHFDARPASHARVPESYPLGSVSGFPAYAPATPLVLDVPRVPAGERIREFEAIPSAFRHSAAATSAAVAQEPGRGSRRMLISWLPPPDLGEVY
jgi:hypothetical protein